MIVIFNFIDVKEILLFFKIIELIGSNIEI